MSTRECPFCGKPVYDRLIQCPYCRETLPEIRVASRLSSAGNGKILRGLFCMLAAAALGYLATGSGGWKPPIPIPPPVITYLSPLLFLLGLGLGLHGLYLRHKTAS
jgi:hypothetical protein